MCIMKLTRRQTSLPIVGTTFPSISISFHFQTVIWAIFFAIITSVFQI
ncbi:hypothetical protein LINPERPRIM_LOCUS796 [Linum perenne]